MAVRDFFEADSRKRVARAIEAVEKQTAAEIVVAVRKRASTYRAVDVAVGAALAFVTLVAIVYLPREFETILIPLDVAVMFALGFALTANVATLKRLIVSRRSMEEHVRTVARAAFYEMGISRTRGRTGVLVLVSMFERKVEIVADVGVTPDAMGAAWREVVAALEGAGRAADFDRFLSGIEAMAKPLASALPAQPDDIDELPNEPVIA
jgi:putative membrane protein